MTKLYLPKTIRTDERLKQIFGDSEPQQQQEDREQEPRPKGNSNYWLKIRKSWLTHRTLRVCANPNCRKQFLPRVPMQRFCCRSCCIRFHNGGKPIDPSKARICECGRYSNYLAIGLDGKTLKCSFCREKENAFKNQMREIERRKAHLEARKQRLEEKKAKLNEQKTLEKNQDQKKIEVLNCMCTKCGAKILEIEVGLFHGLCIDCYFERCLKHDEP